MDKALGYRQKNVHDIPIGGTFVRLWDADGTSAKSVIKKSFQALLRTSFVYPYVALMPDYHPGEGSMIGSVIPTREVLLPSVIGGDLGCGVAAVRLPVEAGILSENFRDIRDRLASVIPAGTAHNSAVNARVSNNAIWNREIKSPIVTNRLLRKLQHQFASLGGGNQFLEVQKDQDGIAWVMLHSGSRYLGVIVRDYYVDAGRSQENVDGKIYSKVPYLSVPSPMATDYLADLQYVMDFARESRKEMLFRALEVMADFSNEVTPDLIDTAYDIAHNYVAEEIHHGETLFLHRKGAIHLDRDEVGLVPGSMGTLSYVVEGRGNEFSYNSCSHGAGRTMSRGDAFRTISEKDFKKSMEGVTYHHSRRLRDESPIAYKDSKQVMRGQKDLVRIVRELQPLVSIKGF